MRPNFFLIVFLSVAFVPVSIPFVLAQEYNNVPLMDRSNVISQQMDMVEEAMNAGTASAVPADPAVSDIANDAGSSPMKRKPFSFGLAEEFFWLTLEEPDAMKQTGFMSGYDLTLDVNPGIEYLNLFRANLLVAKGKVDEEPNDGSYQMDGRMNKTVEIRGIVGGDEFLRPDFRLTPYGGIAYRYQEDQGQGVDAQDGSFLILGYNRTSRRLYIPLGLEAAFQPLNRLSLEGNIEYDILVQGSQINNLDVLPGYSKVNLSQKKGMGLRGALKLNTEFKYCTAFIEWFYRYWSIKQSQSVPDPTDPSFDIYEPKIKSYEVGLRLGVKI